MGFELLLCRRVIFTIAPHIAEHVPVPLRQVLLMKLRASVKGFPFYRHTSKHKPKKKTSTKPTLPMQTYRHLCPRTSLCWPNRVVFGRPNLPPVLLNHSVSSHPRNHPYSLCSRRIISPCLTNSTGLEGSDRSAGGRKLIKTKALTNKSGSQGFLGTFMPQADNTRQTNLCKLTVNHYSSLLEFKEQP